MRAIPGLLMLLAVSSASATASAAKFDLGSVLTSLISDPEKVREDEHARKQQKILDEMNEYSRQEELKREEYSRQEELRLEKVHEYLDTCDSIDRCNTYPGNRRVISGDLENVPYICELDDSEGAERRVYLEYRVDYNNFVYPSKQWLDEEKQCHQRLEAQKEQHGREVQRQQDLEYERQRENDKRIQRKMAEISKLPEPKIGMTQDQVRKGRWGSPIIIELETNTQGKYEKWHYNHTKVLHFKNGKVTKIINAKGGS